MRLIIATKNEKKFFEIKQILCDVKIPIISLNSLTKKIKYREDGNTFLENATKKALAVSRKYPEDFVVAEDSGLVVYALGNKPGIYSKRYSGKNSTDYKNNLKILDELKDLKNNKDRRAYFICVAVLAKNKKVIKKFEGKLFGYIAKKMLGSYGFGYDPIFYLPKYKKTVAQLTPEEKNKISHRSKAFLKLNSYLKKILS